MFDLEFIKGKHPVLTAGGETVELASVEDNRIESGKYDIRS